MRQLPLRAQLYITSLLAAAIGVVLWTAGQPPRDLWQATITVVLALCATLSQLFEVRTPNHKAYVATLSFIGASALLLPPLGTVLVATTPFIVERLVKPKRWYVQAFNTASHVLAAVGAEAVARVVLSQHQLHPAPVAPDGRFLLAGLAASAVLLIVNHATLVVALSWARQVPPRETGLFGAEGLLTDSCLLALGVVIAVLWEEGPAFVLVALVPFALFQRALHFPALQRASRTDLKTGLVNAAYFREVSDGELRRHTRSGASLSVVVADLDLLRNINNAYGHLAGDRVLVAVAEVLRGEVREGDLAARFGGEEFTLLLPGTSGAEAHEIAERIRCTVAAQRIDVSTSPQPLSVTLSLGVATFPDHGRTLTELLHRGDLAVYRAKIEGRDRVRVASPDDAIEQGPAAALTHSPLRLLAGLTGPPDADAGETDPAKPHATEAAARAEPSAAMTGGRRARADGPPAGESPRRRGIATWPVTALVMGAATVLAVVLCHHVRLDSSLAAFPLLAGLAELIGDDLYGSSSISVSAIPIMGAVAAGNPAAAVAAALVAAVVGGLAVRRRLEQTLFNVGLFVLCAGSAAGVRDAVTSLSHVTPSSLPMLLVAMLPATVAYYVVDNGLVTLMVSLDERRHPVSVFRQDFAWLAPHFLAFGMLSTLLGVTWDAFGVTGLSVALLPLVLARVAQVQYVTHTRSQVRELGRLADDLSESKSALEASNAALEHALLNVRERHVATATTLARAIDARDETTGGHIERVCALGTAVCEVVDPDLAADPQVSFGFLLHDIGKIGVPDAVLLKPGPLTPDERDVMNRHPELGATLLADAGFAPVAREIAMTHHERWDGTGYPCGLQGSQIPLCSRLFSVCDALDAMTNDRPYRLGMPLDEALDELRLHAGTQFDPLAVEALLSLDPERIAALLRLEAHALPPTAEVASMLLRPA